MYYVLHYNKREKQWYEGPRGTHDEVYEQMIKLQWNGFEAYTMRVH